VDSKLTYGGACPQRYGGAFCFRRPVSPPAGLRGPEHPAPGRGRGGSARDRHGGSDFQRIVPRVV